jgi:seryl-tRNA synthetase
LNQAEKRSRELSNEIETLRAETKQLGHEVSQISAKAEEAWKQVAHYDHIVAKLNGKRIEARALKKNMEGFGSA